MASKYVLTLVELEAVLQKVEAEGVFDFVDLRATIVADPYPINQYLTDTISFTDAPAFNNAKALGDSVLVESSSYTSRDSCI